MLRSVREILSEQPTDYPESNNILDTHQDEFRVDHSTQNQTTFQGVLYDIGFVKDASKYTIFVLFHFFKASDILPHYILIHKLRSFEKNVGKIERRYVKMALRVNGSTPEYISPMEAGRSSIEIGTLKRARYCIKSIVSVNNYVG